MKNPNELTLNINNINKRIGELLYKIYHTASNVDPLKAELDALDKLVFKVPAIPVAREMTPVQETPIVLTENSAQKRKFDDSEEASYANILALCNSEIYNSQFKESIGNNMKTSIDEAERVYLGEILVDLEEDELMAKITNKEFNEDKAELLYDVRAALAGDKSAILFLKESIMKDDESDIKEIREKLKTESTKEKAKIARSL